MAAKKTKSTVIDGVDISQLNSNELSVYIDKLYAAREKVHDKVRKENKVFTDKIVALKKGAKANIKFSLMIPVDFSLKIEPADYVCPGYANDNFEVVSAKLKLGGDFEGKARKYLQTALDNVSICSDVLDIVPEKALPASMAAFNESVKALEKEIKAAELCWDDVIE